jgi:cytochrome c oxidase assembly protein subunit 15
MKWFAALTSLVLFVVIVAGFVVTDTGSGEGCGGSWPLCHGRFIPAFAFHTAIEFSHRVLAAVAGVLVLALAVWAWSWAGRQRPDLKAVALIGLFGVIAQAILGGLDVLFPESPTVLAFHFGVSLVAFGGVFLTTVLVWQLASARPHGGGPTWRATPASRSYALLTYAALAYTLVVVYVGAYVAHREAGLACLGWPLCSGQLVPDLTTVALLPFLHRVLALVLVLFLAFLVAVARRSRQSRPDLYRGVHLAAVLVVLQALAGAYLVLSRLSLGASLLHIAIMTLLFGVESYLALQVLPEPGRSGLDA